MIIEIYFNKKFYGSSKETDLENEETYKKK